MGASKEIFIKMTEEEYLDIPQQVRQAFFSSKNITKQDNDWHENMKDEYYSTLYKELKITKKLLEEREFQLRELRRKENNK